MLLHSDRTPKISASAAAEATSAGREAISAQSGREVRRTARRCRHCKRRKPPPTRSARPAHPSSRDQARSLITEIATPQPEGGNQSEAGSALASRRPIGRPPIASELVPGLTANSSKPLSSSK